MADDRESPGGPSGSRWERLQRAFDELVGLSRDERAARLLAACDGDRVLAEEVEQLLAADEETGTFAGPAAEWAVLLEEAGAPEDRVGAMVGGFRIVEVIGEGGMGVVYRAESEDAAGRREVALKSLPPELARDASWVRRFEREALALASISHPGVAAFLGMREADDGCLFIVMEHVPGPTLADRIAEGPLEVGEAVAACRDVAVALRAIHERAIVHRDVKPANVKLAPGGARLLDLGIARALETGLLPSLTSTGALVGTPGHASPEQLRGLAVDERTDVWSWGCVLHECLTGRPPFEAENIGLRIAATLGVEPAWERLPEAVPEGLRALLRACLEKERERRPAGFAEVLELLDAAWPPDGAAP